MQRSASHPDYLKIKTTQLYRSRKTQKFFKRHSRQKEGKAHIQNENKVFQKIPNSQKF